MQGASSRTSAWLNFAQLPREQGGLGLATHQAAGLVGNLVNESGQDLNPWGPTGDNGTAWGTAQWRGPRLDGLRAFATGNGLDYRSMEAQQQWMRKEFDGPEKRAWEALQAAKTPEEAASAVNKFYERSANNSGKREQSARALMEQFGGQSTGDSEAMAFAPQQPQAGTTPAPDDGFMGQLLGRIQGKGNGGYDIGDAMAGAGASMMALDNAKGAAVLAAMQQSNRKEAGKTPEWSIDPKSGTFYRTGKDGRLEIMKNPNASDEPAKPKINESALKHVGETMEKYDYLSQSATNAADILDDLNTGKLDLGMLKNWVNSGKNMAGISDEQSRSLARYNQYIQGLVNDNLRLNKGVQTEGDAYRELKTIASNGTSYDNETAKEALKRVISKSQEAVTKRGTAILDSHKKAYGDEPFTPFDDMTSGWKTNFENINGRIEKMGQPQAQPSAAPSTGGFKIIKGPH
jgi:Phage tail lysozyme